MCVCVYVCVCVCSLFCRVYGVCVCVCGFLCMKTNSSAIACLVVVPKVVLSGQGSMGSPGQRLSRIGVQAGIDFPVSVQSCGSAKLTQTLGETSNFGETAWLSACVPVLLSLHYRTVPSLCMHLMHLLLYRPNPKDLKKDLILGTGCCCPRGGRWERTLYADPPPPLPAGFWPGSARPWAPKAP